jgi:uncharacterized membrane protein YdjX (TVP38/TMEM64 family)
MSELSRRWGKLIAILIVLVVLAVLSRVLPVEDWLESLNDWLAKAGPIGWLVFFAIYVIAAVLLIPGSVLTLGAGFAFGLVAGVGIVFVSATAGAGAAFLVSRYLARDAVQKKFGTSPRFAAVDRAVALEGWKIVFMLRLSPVFPYNALNYLLGLTGISFWRYLAASAVGMVPGTLLYVYFGYLGRAGLETASGAEGTLKLVYTALGLVVTAGVTFFVTRLARNALKQHTETDSDAEAMPTAVPKSDVGEEP